MYYVDNAETCCDKYCHVFIKKIAAILVCFITAGPILAMNNQSNVSRDKRRSQYENKQQLKKQKIENKLFGVELAFISPRYQKREEEFGDSDKQLKNLQEEAISLWLMKAHDKGNHVENNKISCDGGFWYVVKKDMKGVIEINTKPLSFDEWAEKETFIQKNIFDLAQEIGLVVDPQYGGHIHLDIAHFENKSLLFLNFFIDCQNHPELFLGIFGLRPNNPPLALRSSTVRDKFVTLLEEFTETSSIDNIAQNIYEDVYYEIAIDESSRNNKSSDLRLQALNLQNIVPVDDLELGMRERKPYRTLEIRGLEAQKDARDLILILKYFAKRIETLKQQKTLIKYNNIAIDNCRSKNKHDAPNPDCIQGRFKKLISETSLLWEEYKHFVEIFPSI